MSIKLKGLFCLGIYGINKQRMTTLEEKPETQIPIGAVMKLLKTNTTQRNIYNDGLHDANTKIRESKELHFATLGRLVKYEGLSIIEEALEYAKNAGLFFECESKYIGVLSVIRPYTNKRGKISLAHYTHYGHFIRLAKEGEQPISYIGYFLYKDFANKLQPYRNNAISTFSKINDIFNFN